MAHLLGSRFCIESLHNDVSDLQATVVDVFSRTGPVSQPSWKYPDKAASRVDVDELLEIYVYTEDEEERQVAHIVLLELVIDRLVVFLQSLAKYVDSMLASGRVLSAVGPSSNSTSIGLVVKKYWSRMVQVHTTSKQLQSETKSKSRKIQELEDTVDKLSEAVDLLRSGTGESMLNLNDSGRKSVNPDAFLPGGMDSTSFANLLATSNANKKKISKDECNKSSQTIETAFVPCEACDRVQTHLREVGKEFVSICRNQDLTSLLDRHMTYVKDIEWMTHNDISRWVGEQNKDLRTLNRHLKDLKATIEPLEEQLSKEQERTRKLQEKVTTLGKQLALEKETQSIQLGQIGAKVEQARAEKQKEVDVTLHEKDRIAFAKREVEGQLKLTLSQLQKAEERLKEYETTQRELEAELHRSKTDNAEIRRLRSELKETECQLDKTRGKLSDASKELNKERARGKSVHKHTESLQGKQDSLIQRIDSLAEENEDLRGQVADLHDDKDTLEEKLREARAQQRHFEGKIDKYESGQRELTTSMQRLTRSGAELDDTKSKLSQVERELEEARERERLIIEYPDLNGPVNKDLVGTGNIAVDMENQVKANSVRIKVLEDQNNTLRKTISRMLQLQTDATEDATNVPLWKQTSSHVTHVEVREYGQDAEAHNDNYSDNEDQPQYLHKRPPQQSHHARPVSPYRQSSPSEENNEDMLFYKRTPPSHYPPAKPKSADKGGLDWVPPDTFTVKPSPKPKSAVVKGTTRQRPISAKPALGGGARPSSSSISAYLSLKHAGKIKSAGPGGRSRSSKPVPDGYKLGDPITCDKCDKTYMHVKDLQIHRNYCFGGS